MKSFLVAFAVIVMACATAGQSQPPEPGGAAPPMQLPDHFTNLKVLPKDISKEDLVHTMKAFSASLGVKCDHCHVLSPEKDFASDKKGEKQMARDMMGLVHKLNTEFFNYRDAPKASCFMCHHGEKKPALQPANFQAPAGAPSAPR
jgi:hypothetical protein